MTPPTSVSDAVQQVKAMFPSVAEPQTRLLFATNGTRVIGLPVDDNPQPIPFAQAPDCVADRHSVRARQEALQEIRGKVAG